MILVRIGNYQLITVNIQRDQVILQRAAIQSDSMPASAHAHGKLIHNPAIHPDENILGPL